MAVSLHNLRQRRVAGVAFGLIAVVVLVLATVVLLPQDVELDGRHSPLLTVGTLDFNEDSLSDYMEWSERRIHAAHGAEVDPALFANLTSFRLEPAPTCPRSARARYQSGVVLTHDALESAYSMRELGAYFQSRCFVVVGITLPGHGTRPGELLNVGWEDWAGAQALATRELGKEVEYLYLAGHGIGGTLAILEASRNAAVTGLVLFAPHMARRPQSWRTAAAAAVGWLRPEWHWSEVLPDYTPYRYASRPWRLDGEINALVDAMQAALPTRPLELPVFLVASQEDAEASTEAMLDYMADRIHPLSHTLLYSAQLVEAERQMTVQVSSLPNSRILSLSHLGLMIPLSDPEFGAGGLSQNCGHYYRQAPELYERCTGDEWAFEGEINAENLRGGLVERSESNPFFIQMQALLDPFLGGTAVVPADPAI